MGWLSETEENNLMGSIHWGYKEGETPKELREFIEEHELHCIKEGIFQFLFFDDAADYIHRFETNMNTSVLGSRPGLYIFKHSSVRKTGEKKGEEKTLKIGEAERLHERMKSHSSGKSPYIEGPGVVIVRSEGTRCDDQFNIHEMRKLCEVLINDFMSKATVKKDYDTVRPTGPRAFVSKEGCKQAKKLMQSLRKSAVHTRFDRIARVESNRLRKQI